MGTLEEVSLLVGKKCLVDFGFSVLPKGHCNTSLAKFIQNNTAPNKLYTPYDSQERTGNTVS